MTLFIGMDDTDTADSRGTGHLARRIAHALSTEYAVLGVARHQLLIDSRVPCTKNNSSAAILLNGKGKTDAGNLLQQVKALMLDDFQLGSDPGLCVADFVPPAVMEFGRRVQQELVTREEAQSLADELSLPLLGLGGDHSGVIGALAAVGLAAGQEDGRYILVGRSRELSGLQPVSAVLAAGIVSVRTADGQPVMEGLIQTDKLRPPRRGGQPVAVVEWVGDHWVPLKID
jgi:tRNA(Ile2) C34 agmatinyltransferase TiaS